MKKVLVTNYVHDHLLTGLERIGYTVEYDQNFDPQGLATVLPDLSGIVINSKIKMTSEMQALAPKLDFIARLGSGLEIIDLVAAKKNGIAVFNSPEGNRNAVAEHAIGMLLGLANNIRRGDASVRQKRWNREAHRGFELEGKTLGIIGLGNTGRELARKLSPWALRIIYNDPYLLEVPEDLSNITYTDINQLQKDADIISLHTQLTEETRGMIDYDFLKNCRKGVILINTARGAIVQTQGLVRALEEEHVSGACLDVFENEKPHSFTLEENQLFERLYAMDNVVLTPHVAGWTHESLWKIAKVLLDKIGSLN